MGLSINPRIVIVVCGLAAVAVAQRTAKKLLNDTEDSTLSIAIELEGHCYSRLRQSDDFKEGVEAFHAKRPAKFKGS